MMDELSMWVVYDHPKDFPEHYVARQWLVRMGAKTASVEATANVLYSESLEAVRDMVMFTAGAGRVNIGRYDDDDPKIVEVWV